VFFLFHLFRFPARARAANGRCCMMRRQGAQNPIIRNLKTINILEKL